MIPGLQRIRLFFADWFDHCRNDRIIRRLHHFFFRDLRYCWRNWFFCLRNWRCFFLWDLRSYFCCRNLRCCLCHFRNRCCCIDCCGFCCDLLNCDRCYFCRWDRGDSRCFLLFHFFQFQIVACFFQFFLRCCLRCFLFCFRHDTMCAIDRFFISRIGLFCWRDIPMRTINRLLKLFCRSVYILCVQQFFRNRPVMAHVFKSCLRKRDHFAIDFILISFQLRFRIKCDRLIHLFIFPHDRHDFPFRFLWCLTEYFKILCRIHKFCLLFCLCQCHGISDCHVLIRGIFIQHFLQEGIVQAFYLVVFFLRCIRLVTLAHVNEPFHRDILANDAGRCHFLFLRSSRFPKTHL